MEANEFERGNNESKNLGTALVLVVGVVGVVGVGVVAKVVMTQCLKTFNSVMVMSCLFLQSL